MRDSAQKDYSVYDFNEDDEVEEASLEKFRPKPRSRCNPETEKGLSKSTFLQAFTSGMKIEQTNVADVSCTDLHASDNLCRSDSINTPERNLSSTEETSGLDKILVSSSSSDDRGHICKGTSRFDKILASSTSYDEHGHVYQDEFEPGNLIGADPHVMGASGLVVPCLVNRQFSELPSNGKLVDVISDDDESWTSICKSSSTTASDLAENEGYAGRQASDNCYTAFREMENDDMAVIVSPDYVVYGNTVYAESQLKFFSDCIKIECSDASGNDGSFASEWAIDDVIHIDCQWRGSVETCQGKLHLRPNAVNGAEKLHGTSVADIRWLEKKKKIMSLAARYKDIWNVIPNAELEWQDGLLGTNMFFSTHFFTEIMDPFEDVIYPKGDPDAVSISKRDFELLQPDTFINDTIIDFYIKYLKNNIQPTEKHRFHFFNSFFFRKLADLDKDPGSASEGRAAFQRVRKWTRKVNIFEKDYIFIPVNFSLHWSLLVICHPGEVVPLKDDEVEESPKVPCILHMDSIKGSHNGLRSLVQSYLWEEWKERHPESPENNSSKFLNLRFVPLELPQQENSFDCGLFLLHYVELFLEEAPVNFNPFNITKFSNFLNLDWFSPAEASLKRSVIRKLIYELLNDPSEKVTPATCSNNHLSSEFPANNIEHEPVVEFLSEQRSPGNTDLCASACSDADRGFDVKLLTTSPLCGIQCDKETRFVLREFLLPGASAVTSPDHQDHPFQQNASFQKFRSTMSPIEECADSGEQFVSPNTDEDGCWPLAESTTTKICSRSFSSKDVGAREMCSIHEKDGDGGSSSGSLNIDHVVSEQKEETEKLLSISMENGGYVTDSPTSASCEYLETSVVEDTQEINTTKAEGGVCEGSEEIDATEAENGMCEGPQEIYTTEVDGGECGGPFLSCQEKHHESPYQDEGPTENQNPFSEDDLRLARDDVISRLELQSYKRQKVTHPEGGRRLTRRFARDCPS